MRFVALALFSVVLVLIQVLIGGAGLVYALPSLLLLGVTGLVLVGVSPEKSSNGMTFWSGIAALGLAAGISTGWAGSGVLFAIIALVAGGT